ncbi:uncharacterized protein LOC121412642 [Lytechinus variegatus]|uniref:uncharacterized protein LOC121412642 n=1 Tax=Lytechinus variegatus TaxID=7654 RepID=UPI001BB15705|nr:uncharacterized protein LOC121412642 [Lytechinus variegatus]
MEWKIGDGALSNKARKYKYREAMEFLVLYTYIIEKQVQSWILFLMWTHQEKPVPSRKKLSRRMVTYVHNVGQTSSSSSSGTSATSVQSSSPNFTSNRGHNVAVISKHR